MLTIPGIHILSTQIILNEVVKQHSHWHSCQLKKIRLKKYIIFGLFYTVFLNCISCKKQEQKDSCSANAAIVRQIDQDSATVKYSDGSYFIFEDGTIDERLLPCSMTDEFKIDNLRVLISGNVKETVQISGSPCCLAYFEIISISK